MNIHSPLTFGIPAFHLALIFTLSIAFISNYIRLLSQAIIYSISSLISHYTSIPLIITNIKYPLHITGTLATANFWRKNAFPIKIYRLHLKKYRYFIYNGCVKGDTSVFSYPFFPLKIWNEPNGGKHLINSRISKSLRSTLCSLTSRRERLKKKILTLCIIINNKQDLTYYTVQQKMSNLYSYSEAIKKPTAPMSSSSNRPPKHKVNQTQLLLKSYESMIDKQQELTLLDNALALALRAEMTYTSTLILIGGLPLDHVDWPPTRLNQ